jgi:putative redox protein
MGEAAAEPGRVTLRCAAPVDQVIHRLEVEAEARGLTVFARIDHAAGAAAAGLTLAPTVLLLLGDARGGTPLMALGRSVGLDLPLRLLAWEDALGAVWLTYDDPAAVAARHDLGEAGATAAARLAALLEVLAGAAADHQTADAPDEPPIRVHDFGSGLKAQVAADGQRWLVDEPVEAGGTGLGPSPHGLLAAGLAACTTLTLRLYADRKAWPLEHINVAVSHEKEADQSPPDLFRRSIRLQGPLDSEQTARLKEIADRCPVHKTLTTGSRIVTEAWDED